MVVGLAIVWGYVLNAAKKKKMIFAPMSWHFQLLAFRIELAFRI
jgi:hypothetical protein